MIYLMVTPKHALQINSIHRNTLVCGTSPNEIITRTHNQSLYRFLQHQSTYPPTQQWRPPPTQPCHNNQATPHRMHQCAIALRSLSIAKTRLFQFPPPMHTLPPHRLSQPHHPSHPPLPTPFAPPSHSFSKN